MGGLSVVLVYLVQEGDKLVLEEREGGRDSAPGRQRAIL